MKTSDSISKIAPALLAAQKKITFAEKNAKNPHFKNDYADLPSVINAVKEALNSEGIFFSQSASPTSGLIAPLPLFLTTRLIHSSGEWIEDTAVIPLPKQDPQGYGSALTYGRRYSLASIMGLYQDDDDGEGAALHRPEATQKPANAVSSQPTANYKPVGPMASAATLKALETLCFDLTMNEKLNQVLHSKNLVSFSALSEEDASKLLKWATSPAKK